MTSVLKDEDIKYFDRGKVENPKFWSRFDTVPVFKDKTILDLGCGHGSMCVYLAGLGAKKVVGIDLDNERIDFALSNLELNFPQYKDIVEFRCIDLKDYTDLDFNIIISKDSFEHIINLEDVIKEITNRLKSGGRLYTGFAPLYKVFNGDHGRTKAIFPWGHLIIPERVLLKRLNKKSLMKINSVYDLGLNKLSLAEYKKIFKISGMDIVFFKVNNAKHPVARLFKLISKIPFLEEYFSYFIHAVLEKK